MERTFGACCKVVGAEDFFARKSASVRIKLDRKDYKTSPEAFVFIYIQQIPIKTFGYCQSNYLLFQSLVRKRSPVWNKVAQFEVNSFY